MTEDSLTSGGATFPPCREWPHRPIYVLARSSTTVLDVPKDMPLPLGVPVAFETPLFKGKLLIRLRNAATDDVASHEAYFAGRNRVMQTVVQGRFKKDLPMSEVYAGCLFKEPLRQTPPPFFMRLLNMILQRVSPGAIIDLHSPCPRVLSLYAGSAQTVSMDAPGEEPDIAAVDLPENFPGYHKPFRSSSDRKRKLAKPSQAARYEFDVNHVYTLQIYDQSMDYGSYSIRLPIYGNYHLSPAIGPQPMSLSAVTTGGEIVYDFSVWHESVYRLKYPDAV
jgi:hypothetical protein